MIQKFIPNDVKKGKFDGHVEIDMPSNSQRLSMMYELNIEFDEKGNVNLKGAGALKIMVGLFKALKTRLIVVNIQKGDIKYKNYEDLDNDPECQDMMTEMCNALLEGIKLGKKQK